MEEYQERVVQEEMELVDKASKLGVFMNTVTYTRLPAYEQSLLAVQKIAMENYLYALRGRIDLFAKPDEPAYEDDPHPA